MGHSIKKMQQAGNFTAPQDSSFEIITLDPNQVVSNYGYSEAGYSTDLMIEQQGLWSYNATDDNLTLNTATLDTSKMFRRGTVKPFFQDEFYIYIYLCGFSSLANRAKYKLNRMGYYDFQGTANITFEISDNLYSGWSTFHTTDLGTYQQIKQFSLDSDTVQGSFIRISTDSFSVFPIVPVFVGEKISGEDPITTLTPTVPAARKTVDEFTGACFFIDSPIEHEFLKSGRLYGDAGFNYDDSNITDREAKYETAGVGDMDARLNLLKNTNGKVVNFNLYRNPTWNQYASGEPKSIPVNKDSADRTLAANYSYVKKFFTDLTDRYASNSGSANVQSLDSGETEKKGLDYVSTIQVGNEPIVHDWEVPNTTDDTYGSRAFGRVEETMPFFKECYDAIKAIDSSVEVDSAPITEFYKSIVSSFFHYIEETYSGTVPWDNFTFNHYMSDTTEGQNNAIDGQNTGVSPEESGLRAYIQESSDYYHTLFPNTRLKWTEFGWDTVDNPTTDPSAFKCPALIDSSQFTTQAHWLLRAYIIAYMDDLLDEAHMYMQRDVNNPTNQRFQKCGLYGQKKTYVRKPSWYALKTFITQSAGFENPTAVTWNNDTGLNVVKLTHESNGSELFYIWSGTSDGTTLSSQVIDVNATHTRARIVEFGDYEENGYRHLTTITSNQVTLDVTEKVKILITDTTAIAAPSAPTNLRVRNITEDTLDISWEYTTDVQTTARVQYNPGTTWQDLGTVTGGVNTFSETGGTLDPDTLIDFRVRLENSAGNSAWSSEVQRKTASASAVDNTYNINFTGTTSHTNPGGWTEVSGHNPSVGNVGGSGIDIALSGWDNSSALVGYAGGDQTIPGDVNFSIIQKVSAGTATITLSSLNAGARYNLYFYPSRDFRHEDNVLIVSTGSFHEDRANGLVNDGTNPAVLMNVTPDGSQEIVVTCDRETDNYEFNLSGMRIEEIIL